MKKWKKLLSVILLLLSVSGCTYGTSISRPSYPYNCPFNNERDCHTWFMATDLFHPCISFSLLISLWNGESPGKMSNR
jgi:hypothetical protein